MRRLRNIDPLAPEARGRDDHDRLIPMINVVFLLLTFFLMAGTLRVADSSGIEPPDAATSGKLERGNPVLTVTSDGEIALDGETVILDSAVASIGAMLQATPGLTLHIRADRDAPASIILPLLRALRDAGVEKLRLIAVKRAAD